MDSGETCSAYIIAKRVADATPGAVIRHSDVSGADVLDDPRVREQLEIIRGRRLSQFSMSRFGLRLAFRGEESGSSQMRV